MKDINTRFEPRKRIALDGKIWWCVYDTKAQQYSSRLCFGKYKRKMDCAFAIKYALQKYSEII